MTCVREQFEESGYVVLPGLLNARTVHEYLKTLHQLSGVKDSDYGLRHYRYPEGITKEAAFWSIIFNDVLVTTIREILGPKARFAHHTDLQSHEGGVFWHRDSICPEYGIGFDWDPVLGDYRIARAAIYLESHERSGFCLGVVPGSHKYEERLTSLEIGIRRGLRRFRTGHPTSIADAEPRLMRTRKYRLPYLHEPTLPVWIEPDAGDCVIIHQRLYHSSSELRGPHYAMYLSYGVESEHTLNQIRYFRYFRKDLDPKPVAPELVRRLQEAQLHVAEPEPIDPREFKIQMRSPISP